MVIAAAKHKLLALKFLPLGRSLDILRGGESDCLSGLSMRCRYVEKFALGFGLPRMPW